MDIVPQLICEQCRQRKRKCDKGVPCSACKVAGLACSPVRRRRRPRGKSGKSKPEHAHLEERIGRIERLLATREGQVDRCDGQSGAYISPSGIAPDRESKDSFWGTLENEVKGLRESIKDQVDDDPATDHHDEGGTSSSADFTIPLPLATYDHERIVHQPDSPLTRDIKARLLELYRSRVDNVFKILHWPTAMMTIDNKSLSCTDYGTMWSALALESAIHFLALCTVDDGECESTLGAPKGFLLDQSKHRLEDALSRADLLRTPNVVGLQAFALYIKGLRASGCFSSSWTLLALAYRIATALNLSIERKGENNLDTEIRRRLWCCICLLDTQSVMDKGTAPLIGARDLGCLPLNLNDDDIAMDGLRTSPTESLTEMSFSLLTFEAMVCQKTASQASTWEEKSELVCHFETSVRAKYIDSNPVQAPIEMMLKQSAMGIITNMQLLIRRPPYRQVNHVPLNDTFDLFGTAIAALEFQLSLQSPELSPWKWKEWPPWYALAIVLAELCKDSRSAYRVRAFKAAQETYRRFAKPSTDPESGVVWRPISKLMRRVTKDMERIESESPGNISTLVRNTAAPLAIPVLPQYNDVTAEDHLSSWRALQTNAIQPPLPDDAGISQWILPEDAVIRT